MFLIICIKYVWFILECPRVWSRLVFLVFAFLGVSRPNASTCSQHTHYNSSFCWRKRKSHVFVQKLYFTQKIASNLPKPKTIETKDALIWKLPTCEKQQLVDVVASQTGQSASKALETKAWKLLLFIHSLQMIFIAILNRYHFMKVLLQCVLLRSFWYKFVTRRNANANLCKIFKFNTNLLPLDKHFFIACFKSIATSYHDIAITVTLTIFNFYQFPQHHPLQSEVLVLV